MVVRNPSLHLSRLVLVIAALAPLAFATAGETRSPFDGRWSIRVMADIEECALGRAVPLRVSDGRISYGGLLGAVATGQVRPNGKVRMRMAHATDVVNATGALKGATGSGRWASATSECVGDWSARKA
jgi:hypothetical protein